MAGLQLTITNAGRAALVNAQNTGSAAVVVTQIGLSATHYAGALAALTAIPAETKRLTTFGGSVVADDTFHLSVRDETADVYSLRLFGLYLGDGTLFAVYSQAGVILEKSAAAIMLLAVDVVITALGTTGLAFGSTEFLNPPATTMVQGVVELATPAETATGTDGTRAVTPLGLIQTLMTWATGFAAAVHNHDASAIVSGVLQVGRIPALGMEKITGLAVALTGKSNSGHTHDASEIPSGVFDVARIPALAMAKITGLANALSEKAAVYQPLFRKEAAGTREGGQINLEAPDISALTANVAIDVYENQLRFLEQGGSFRGVSLDFTTLPGVGTAFLWHTSNFNPATKATLEADVAFRDVLASRGNGSGIVYLGRYDRSLFFNGAEYQMPGAPLSVPLGVVSGGFPVWTSGNFNPETKATVQVDVEFRDILASRGNGSGIVYLGRYDRSVFFNGAEYQMPGAPLSVPLGVVSGGYPVWTSGDFNPSTFAIASSWNNPASASLVTAAKAFQSTGGLGQPSTSVALEARAQDAGSAAFMAFHRPFSFGSHFGLDTDDQLKFGGWSMGAAAYRMWHEGNDDRVAQLGLFPLAAAPAGWLKANGAAVSRATYAALFARIGVDHGAGDGATTFNIPDWRGWFFRGWDDGRGLDAGRVLNTGQSSQNLQHSHGLPIRSNANSGNGYVEDADSSGSVGSAETFVEGGSEARPVNIALLACIKY